MIRTHLLIPLLIDFISLQGVCETRDIDQRLFTVYAGLEIRKIWRWPKMATARVSAVAMATAKLAQQKWALLKWSLIQRSLHQFLNYWKAFWMGFIEFTKMAITSLKIGHFHPDFAQLRWPFLATVGLSGGGHCGGQLAWPPRISRPEVFYL